jgi:hypothetical protein
MSPRDLHMLTGPNNNNNLSLQTQHQPPAAPNNNLGTIDPSLLSSLAAGVAGTPDVVVPFSTGPAEAQNALLSRLLLGRPTTTTTTPTSSSIAGDRNRNSILNNFLALSGGSGNNADSAAAADPLSRLHQQLLGSSGGSGDFPSSAPLINNSSSNNNSNGILKGLLHTTARPQSSEMVNFGDNFSSFLVPSSVDTTLGGLSLADRPQLLQLVQQRQLQREQSALGRLLQSTSTANATPTTDLSSLHALLLNQAASTSAPGNAPADQLQAAYQQLLLNEQTNQRRLSNNPLIADQSLFISDRLNVLQNQLLASSSTTAGATEMPGMPELLRRGSSSSFPLPPTSTLQSTLSSSSAFLPSGLFPFQQDITFGDSNGLPAPDLPVTIALSGDKAKLSEHQVLLRLNIEVFRATKADVSSYTRGRNKPITLHQVGIRCKHCSHLPADQRQKGSTYFPATLIGR